MSRCSRCKKDAKWQLPGTVKVYCLKHVPQKKTVIPIKSDPFQTQLI